MLDVKWSSTTTTTNGPYQRRQPSNGHTTHSCCGGRPELHTDEGKTEKAPSEAGGILTLATQRSGRVTDFMQAHGDKCYLQKNKNKTQDVSLFRFPFRLFFAFSSLAGGNQRSGALPPPTVSECNPASSERATKTSYCKIPCLS